MNKLIEESIKDKNLLDKLEFELREKDKINARLQHKIEEQELAVLDIEDQIH